MSQTNLQATLERIMNWLLIISGLAAGILSVADPIFNSDELSLFKSVTWMLLGLIAIGLGLERLITYDRIEKTIERSAGGTRLDTWEEVYATASKLVKTAQRQVRATAFGQEKWAGPDEYLETVAKVAQSNQRANKPFVYQVIFGYGEKPDVDRAKHILHRKQLFRDRGVAEMLEMKNLSTNWDLDLLIVDDRHLIIAFPLFQKPLRIGIVFNDQPDLVKPIAQWYEQHLWSRASPVNWNTIQELANKNK